MAAKEYIFEHTFPLELGGGFKQLRLGFNTFGNEANKATKTVWICHALTGNTDAQDWWPEIFTKKGAYNPEEYFFVCVNVIGSCYGSTNPLDINPDTQEGYYKTFPIVTTRDYAAAFNHLRKVLGIPKIHTLIGGSLGGQTALEWACSFPKTMERLIVVAANAFHSPWGRAFNESQRMAIETDSTWTENNPKAGEQGLKTARSIALLSYRTAAAYNRTQTDDYNVVDNFKAYSYQRYQGDKITTRFNAHSYWYLSKTMDIHDVGRSRGGINKALEQVQAKSLFVGINSDILFTAAESKEIANKVPNSLYAELESEYGHDGFLIETKQLIRIIKNFTQLNNEY